MHPMRNIAAQQIGIGVDSVGFFDRFIERVGPIARRLDRN
jgi:hypothetical protein